MPSYDRIREIGAAGLKLSTRQGEQIYIGLDTLRFDPFKKREVRQALNYAVNSDAIVKNLLLGYAVRLNGPFFPTTPATTRPQALPYDPDAPARGVAGYAAGFDVGSPSRPLRGVRHGGGRGDRQAAGALGVRARLVVRAAAMFDAYAAKSSNVHVPWKSAPRRGGTSRRCSTRRRAATTTRTPTPTG
jgi:hypothetical protein